MYTKSLPINLRKKDNLQVTDNAKTNRNSQRQNSKKKARRTTSTKKVCGSRSWPHSLCTHRYLNLNSNPLKITSHVSIALEITGIRKFLKHIVFCCYLYTKIIPKHLNKLWILEQMFSLTQIFENFANQKMWRDSIFLHNFLFFPDFSSSKTSNFHENKILH